MSAARCSSICQAWRSMTANTERGRMPSSNTGSVGRCGHPVKTGTICRPCNARHQGKRAYRLMRGRGRVIASGNKKGAALWNRLMRQGVI